jgi:hypothetical protein
MKSETGNTSAKTAKTSNPVSSYFGWDPIRLLPGVFFEGEDKGASDTGNSDTEKEKDGTETDSDKSGDNESDKSKEKEKEAEAKFTQKDLDSLAGRVRAEERTKLEDERKKEKEKAEAEDKKKQGKYEELYSDLKKKEDTEYTPAIELNKRLSEQMNSLIQSEIKDWPSEAKEFDPGETDVAARMDWLNKARPIAKKLSGTPNINHEHSEKTKKNGKDTTDSYLAGAYSVPGKKD